MLGTKLQGKYGHLGFKYKKSDKTLTRHSKNFTYMIAFSSFGGNTKDSISIEVCYIINTRPYDPYGYAKPDINTQPLFYSLRDNEIYLDIEMCIRDRNTTFNLSPTSGSLLITSATLLIAKIIFFAR